MKIKPSLRASYVIRPGNGGYYYTKGIIKVRLCNIKYIKKSLKSLNV